MTSDEQDPGPAPRLRIVPAVDLSERQRFAEQASEEKRRRARSDLDDSLRALAANVMRIVRGAGRPKELARDCADVLGTIDLYHEAFGGYPRSEEIAYLLAIREEPVGSDPEPEYSIHQMTRGALQCAASALARQRTQQLAGEAQLLEGARGYGDYLADQRARWKAANAKVKPNRKSASKRAATRKGSSVKHPPQV